LDVSTDLSKQMEDYLKNIYKLQEESSPVTTKAIAEKMEISPASVTSMTKKLDQLKLLNYKRYGGVVLTERGMKVALEIIRHHRLLELYLNQKVGIEWHKVDAEAEELEHVLSEEVEAAMDHALDYPTIDPHGDPIPAKDGTIISPEETVLIELEPGRASVVSRVIQDSPEMLEYLGGIGIFPDVPIEVEEQTPLAGTVTVRVKGKSRALGRDVASCIYVSSANSSEN
jgi:DtxR family transcriptional regulator, Mn-dependent transcriptional regulator